MKHRALIVTLLGTIATSSFAAAQPPMSPQDAKAMLSAASPDATVSCTKNTFGFAACTVDGNEAALGDCRDNMSFGGVVNPQGTSLMDGFHAATSRPIAHVGKKQLLCVVATVRTKGMLTHALVKVVPTASVSYCKGNDACKGGDQPVKWTKATQRKACTDDGKARYVGDCATGWVKPADIEEYTMGLRAEDTGA